METALADLSMTSTPDMPTRETCGAWLALRRDVVELQDLKRKVQVRADGARGDGPEGRGKRTHKGKVCGAAPAGSDCIGGPAACLGSTVPSCSLSSAQ